jgi:hypothetical protein
MSKRGCGGGGSAEAEEEAAWLAHGRIFFMKKEGTVNY